MPQSLARILVHLIFSTKQRAPVITSEVQPDLWRYLGAACGSLGCSPCRVGGTADHVHVVCELARTISVSNLVQEIKQSSSKWMKTKGDAAFAWQNGYGAFSVAQSQLERTVAYVDSQNEHHRVRTFQEEYREFLARHQISFDERYVWD
jgi:REP element-mobilizing transposase RayT